MAIRATITTVRASADPTYVALSASITNVNAKAIVFLNPVSKYSYGGLLGQALLGQALLNVINLNQEK